MQTQITKRLKTPWVETRFWAKYSNPMATSKRVGTKCGLNKNDTRFSKIGHVLRGVRHSNAKTSCSWVREDRWGRGRCHPLRACGRVTLHRNTRGPLRGALGRGTYRRRWTRLFVHTQRLIEFAASPLCLQSALIVETYRRCCWSPLGCLAQPVELKTNHTEEKQHGINWSEDMNEVE